MLKKNKEVYDDGRYEKFMAIEKETGKKTAAITLSRKRVAIGPDVWRMSNKADTCEYPFKVVNCFEFEYYYRKVKAPDSFLSYEEDEVADEASTQPA